MIGRFETVGDTIDGWGVKVVGGDTIEDVVVFNGFNDVVVVVVGDIPPAVAESKDVEPDIEVADGANVGFKLEEAPVAFITGDTARLLDPDRLFVEFDRCSRTF